MTRKLTDTFVYTTQRTMYFLAHPEVIFSNVKTVGGVVYKCTGRPIAYKVLCDSCSVVVEKSAKFLGGGLLFWRVV